MELVNPERGRPPSPGSNVPTGGLRGRGAFRHKVLLIADGKGTDVMPGEVPLPRKFADRIQSVTRESTMARFVWADSRILEPGHFMSSLVPPRRIPASAPPWNRHSESAKPAHAKSVWGRVLPWAAAIVAAGTGFIVFLYRAA